ncbi:nucleoside diphosphate kinase regulator [Alsobacter soli]|uniref:Nucleoside diphosphate kinase regulator n=1 Tax=Alsobacter soli TaxID=2109933 RepID=A0A2T1HMN2_9HYPH|nr:nucleoside diphosphate kinase regulator [Alsobacter soli]PSC02897.1 nucleoside diphosphate kinase regulator [Alsobacter soli]
MPASARVRRQAVRTPPVSIEAEHYRRLSALAAAASATHPEVSEFLAGELERASVVERLPRNVVGLGSLVRFRDECTGRTQEVVLVYPQDADIEKKRVSVLTPIGAALLGVAAGRAITFHTHTGEQRELTVLNVARAEAEA